MVEGELDVGATCHNARYRIGPDGVPVVVVVWRLLSGAAGLVRSTMVSVGRALKRHERVTLGGERIAAIAAPLHEERALLALAELEADRAHLEIAADVVLVGQENVKTYSSTKKV